MVDDSTVRTSSSYMQLLLDQFGSDYDSDQDAITFHRLISWFGDEGILGDGTLGLNNELLRAAQQLSTEATAPPVALPRRPGAVVVAHR